MNTTLTKYNEARRPLEAILTAVPAGRWSAPTPCEEWTARDVVAHLVDTQREFLTGRGLDVGAAPDMEADPASGWHAHAQRVVTLIADDSVVAGEYDGFFGPTTTGETLEQFYIWDMLVHRWDIATATGLAARLSDDELDGVQQGAEAFGEGLHMEGICKPEVEVGPGGDRQAHILAKLGRRAT